MARPPAKKFNLKEKIERLKAAGFTVNNNLEEETTNLTKEERDLEPLPKRIQMILGILQSSPIKSTTMNYFIMYDIQNDKVRTLVAKYLLSQGCIRVQKSVFLCHSTHKKFDEIRNTLAEINEVYENKDSIILIPLNISDARSMKLIGHNVNIEQIIDPPNTVFI